MFSQTAGRSAHVPAAAAPAGALDDVIRALSTLLRVTLPVDRERVLHLWWLAAFVACGAVVRFWGLGSVGLHGDEETMAMAVRHILIDGRPILPSGMFYPRGVTQLYLMATSVSIFGESEWSLRLPSAICGVLLVALTYIVGRRFLRPHWNLALAAAVAFLPDLIVDSQTARMYIFMVTAITGSMACMFAWERTERIGWLVAAALLVIIGIDMHLLAVAAVLMFLFPGLLRGDLRKLLYGAAAALIVGAAYVAINKWTSAQYPVPPPEFAADLGPPPWERSRATQSFALTFDIALWMAGLAIAVFALYVCRAVATRRLYVIASAALLIVGIALQLLLCYHLAALSYLVGIVIARRFGSPQVAFRLALFVIAIGILALLHATLMASTPGSLVRLVGALIGQPSVWPYVRVAQLSLVAGMLTAALLVWGIYQLAHGRRVTDYWLLAVLGVWAPVFALGFFAWNVPPRYTEMSLPPMLLCAFAFAQRAADWVLAHIPRARGKSLPDALAAVAIAVCVVSPADAAAVINAGYSINPDHKGAAEFMRTQHITDQDIVLAEDVLEQTYYLGAVDYWVIGKQVARRFVKRAGNGVVDFYTGTPVIASAAMLDELLQRHPQARIYVIGSGEQQADNRLNARGPELHAVLESDRFLTVYLGRDGLTKVLRAAPGVRQLPSEATTTRAKRDAKALAAGAEAAAKKSSSAPKKAAQPAPALPE
jgi:4-amino-4-deoxy-L-arabinose transferase-like glycosyltransferase